MPSAAPAWRLVIDASPRSAAANMAIDEAMAETVASGSAPPTLRLYAWSPHAVSIGRFQSTADLDSDAAGRRSLDLVRRLSGGRALLHGDEVTYAIALPARHPLAQGGVLESYRKLSEGLIHGLRRLGVEPDPLVHAHPARRDLSAACMEVPSAYEITVEGRKLMGSAQCRRAGYVLQHGSLPLSGAASSILELLRLDRRQRDRLHAILEQGTVTVSQILSDPRWSGWRETAGALAQGFGEGLGLSLQAGKFGPDEMERAAELIRRRYAHDEWTFQR